MTKKKKLLLNKAFEEKKYFCVKKKNSESFLNYATKKRCLLRPKRFFYHAVHSPYPTLRTIDSIPLFKKWIEQTVNPQDYEIVVFTFHNKIKF